MNDFIGSDLSKKHPHALFFQLRQSWGLEVASFTGLDRWRLPWLRYRIGSSICNPEGKKDPDASERSTLGAWAPCSTILQREFSFLCFNFSTSFWFPPLLVNRTSEPRRGSLYIFKSFQSPLALFPASAGVLTIWFPSPCSCTWSTQKTPWKESIACIFKRVQLSVTNHRKNCVALWKVYGRFCVR